MKSTLKPLAVLFTFSLAACGGGGGGSDAPPAEQAAATTEAATPAPEAPTAAVTSAEPQGDVPTAELRVDRDYLLNQETDLSVVVEQDGTTSSYLSVCSDFQETPAGYSINYQSCILKTRLSGSAAYNIQVPDVIDQLIAVRWFYSDSVKPAYSLWERNAEKAVFTVQ